MRSRSFFFFFLAFLLFALASSTFACASSFSNSSKSASSASLAFASNNSFGFSFLPFFSFATALPSSDPFSTCRALFVSFVELSSSESSSSSVLSLSSFPSRSSCFIRKLISNRARCTFLRSREQRGILALYSVTISTAASIKFCSTRIDRAVSPFLVVTV